MKRLVQNKPSGTFKGFSYLEVLIGVAIFSTGLLTFAQFQGNLTRSSMDAKWRTMAANIGEEVVETQRRFSRLQTDPAGIELAYQDIGNTTLNISRGGVSFTIAQTVTDYYWDRANDQFSTTAPTGQVHSDFKRIALDVAWADPLEFRTIEGQTTSGHLGSGHLPMVAIISSQPSTTGRLALIDNLNGETFQPPTGYPPVLEL